MEEISVTEGVDLYQQGDFNTNFFYLLKGKLEMYLSNESL